MIKHPATLLCTGLLTALLCPGSSAASGWTYSGAGSMSVSRYDHTATLLPSGRVLVAGGSLENTSILASAELYDQVTGAWSLTGAMSTPRHMHKM